MAKILLIIQFSILNFQFLIANTHLVPEDYPTIQSAIDGSSFEGDTILVAPGSYVENIDYNGKNIYLTSYYYFTEHDSSIHTTIIDGNQNGSVVTFYGGETRDAVLNGFTITNGSGRGGSFTHGGGFYIRDASPSILNCLIKHNSVHGLGNGGGMLIANSTVFLSNLIVTENYAESQDSGGIYFSNSDAEMDSVNRCSVFLNEAADHNDLKCNPEFEFCPSVFLDTASVATLDDYFIKNIDVVDILNAKLEKVAEDLYVSPDGDNQNSGSTPEEPLKNISYALHIVDADSLNPRVIYLLPGVYSPSGGQHFPLNLRSYVSLIGAGKENTIIDLEQVKSYVMMGANYEKNITLSTMTIKNGYIDIDVNLTAYTLSFYQNSGLVIDNIRFTQILNSNLLVTGMLTSNMEWQDYTNTIIRNCEFDNNTVLTSVLLSGNTDILVQNCKFDSNLPVESEDNWIDDAHLSMGIHGHIDTYEFPYTRRIENCIFSNNINNHSGQIGVQTVALGIGSLNYPIDIVNCTFADNISNFYSISIASDHLEHTKARFVNCILWNDDLPYEIFVPEDYFEGEEMVCLNMAYNDVQNGTSDFLFEGAVTLTYEDSNLDTYPLFVNPEEGDYTLQPNSPLIDAGTALYIVDGDTVVNLSPDQYYGDAPDIGAYEWQENLSNNIESVINNFELIQCYPNPFNPTTTISFTVEIQNYISLKVFDLYGRLVETLLDGYVSTGYNEVVWDASNFASGNYVAKLTTPNMVTSQKLILVK